MDIEELELMLSRKLDGQVLSTEEEERLQAGLKQSPELAGFDAFQRQLKTDVSQHLKLDAKRQEILTQNILDKTVHASSRRDFPLYVKVAATLLLGVGLFYAGWKKPLGAQTQGQRVEGVRPVGMTLEKTQWDDDLVMVQGGMPVRRGVHQTLWVVEEPVASPGLLKNVSLEVERLAPRMAEVSQLTYR